MDRLLLLLLLLMALIPINSRKVILSELIISSCRNDDDCDADRDGPLFRLRPIVAVQHWYVYTVAVRARSLCTLVSFLLCSVAIVLVLAIVCAERSGRLPSFREDWIVFVS